ncbi:hypothetical protein B9J78_01555 [bacterium Unc6]|nr:hypothetical protein [bacterium Unc6]
MRKFILFFLVVSVIICIIFLLGFLSGQKIVNISSLTNGRKDTLIVCFGEDLTAGRGVPLGEDYPSQLAKMLNKVVVVNVSAEGRTTESAIDVLKRDVLTQNPQIVIIELGRQDFFKRIPVDQTFQNLEKIILEIQKKGAVCVILGLKMGMKKDEYSYRYKKLAEEFGCIYIPNWLDGVMTNPRYRSGLYYPNSQGYRILAERVARKIKRIVR